MSNMPFNNKIKNLRFLENRNLEIVGLIAQISKRKLNIRRQISESIGIMIGRINVHTGIHNRGFHVNILRRRRSVNLQKHREVVTARTFQRIVEQAHGIRIIRLIIHRIIHKTRRTRRHFCPEKITHQQQKRQNAARNVQEFPSFLEIDGVRKIPRRNLFNLLIDGCNEKIVALSPIQLNDIKQHIIAVRKII